MSTTRDDIDDHRDHDHDHPKNDNNNNNDDDDDDEETGNDGGDNTTGKKTSSSNNNALSKMKMLSVSKKASELFHLLEGRKKIDYPKLECTLRITLTGSIGVALCLWAHKVPNNNLVPISMAYVLGMFTVVLPYSAPHLVCTILLVFPSILFILTIAFIGTTTVLGGVLISDGMTCFIYTLYCLLMSFLYFGKQQIQTKGNVPAFVALVGMFVISFKPLIAAKDTPSALKELWTTSGITNPLAVYQNFLIIAGWSMFIVTIVILFIPPIRTARSIIVTKLIPGALMVSVQLMESCGNTNNNGEETSNTGGDEGNEQSHDEQQKLLLAKGKDTLAHLQSVLEDGNVASLTIFEPRLCKPNAPVYTILKELVEATDEIVLVAFEIIIISENSNENDENSNDNDKSNKSKSKFDLQNKFVQKYIHIIKSCAIAISQNNSSSEEELQELLSELENDELQHYIVVRPGIDLLKSTIKWLNVYNNNNNNNNNNSDPNSSNEHKDSYSSTSFIMKNLIKLLFISLFAGPVLPTLKRLVEVIFVLLPFKVHKIWDTWTVLYCLKVMSGFVVLFIMSIYWDKFEKFGISTDIQHHGKVGGIFSGWHIASFAFALLPTKEGTIKKGTQRILGTAVGGFLAWSGLIICSGFTTDDTTTEDIINPGGLLAYITIICFIVTYWTYPNGIEAYFGSSKDHGYVGLYLLVTLILVTLETYLGMGYRDDLTVNRIVATITGALMAMIVSVIPPTVSGGNPYHAKKALRLQKEAFKSFITSVLANDEGVMKSRVAAKNSGDNKDPEGEIEVQYKEQQQDDDDDDGDTNNKRNDSNYGHYDEAIELIDQAKEKRNLATTLCKNANMFHILPIFNVNPLLPIEIDHLGLDEMLIRRTIEYTATKQQQEDEEGTNGGGNKPKTGLGGGSMRGMDEVSKLRFQTVLVPLRSSSDDNENEDDNDKMKEEEGPTTITTEGGGISLMDFLHSNGLDDAGVPMSEWEIISKGAVLLQRRLHEREMSLNSI